jgi:hypothetical protein
MHLACWKRWFHLNKKSRSARVWFRPSLERLEDWMLPSSFTVTNTVDAGTGSFRQAILDANANSGFDTIKFAIPGSGVHTISPLSALPTITDPVAIDGTTQTGYSSQPLIQLDGTSAGSGVTGLWITAGGSTVKALAISHFGGSGIVLQSKGTNTLSKDYIGTDATGSVAEGNVGAGIEIFGGSSGNHLTQNVVSGNGLNNNGAAGVYISDTGTNSNVLTGNYVGLDATGHNALGNEGVGVFLANGVQGTLIGTNGDGTNDAGERNIISANGFQGIAIDGKGTNGNIVAGDYIGTDVTGTVARANGSDGITVFQGAEANRIGVRATDADAAAEDNVISGNTYWGVQISDPGSNANIVDGNLIGTDPTGMSSVPNVSGGVIVNNGAQSNRIGSNGDGVGDNLERNLISGNGTPGNGAAGVYVTDKGTNLNTVAGNYVGTNINGTGPLANQGVGVFIVNGAQSNRIGTDGKSTDDAGERNVISANNYQGVAIFGTGTNANLVAGDYIGVDSSGAAPLGNQNNGIWIGQGAQSNRIGTNGTDPDVAGEANVIGSNVYSGIYISDPGSNGNKVAGNFIGIDKSGTVKLGNGNWGVAVANGAQSDSVGGSPILANTIADNALAGVAVLDPSVVGISIRGNSIFGNGGLGIDLGASGVQAEHGGAAAGANNLQNYPVITAATPGSTTSVSGTLNSLPSTTYKIDFYADPSPDVTFYGPGETYLGFISVTTNAQGNAKFSSVLNSATTAGEWITATATDPAGNTSEFSGDRPLPFTLPKLTPTSWTPIGPSPVAQSPEYTGPVMSGRVSSAAPLPGNNNTMYLAADGGGIWKTNDWLDPSPVWTPLTDGTSSTVSGDGNIGYKTVVVCPSNTNILYAAVQGPGGGILKSSNGGTTWTLLGNTVFDRVAFGSIVVNPTNASIVYVTVWYGPNANSGGVWKSTNGGGSWTNLTAGIHVGAASDLVMDPANASILYAGLTQDNNTATNGLYRTANGGTTWTRLAGGFPLGSTIGPSIRVAIAPSSPSTVYATVFDVASGLPKRYGSSNSGTNWSALAPLPTDEESRYWHVVLSVDPGNAKAVYVNGDHTLYHSVDGGQHWSELNGSEDPVGVFFDDAGNYILVGDHGIYAEGANPTVQINKQGNLQVSEFYTLTLDPTNPAIAYGVAQDQFADIKYDNYPVWTAIGVDPVNGGGNGSGETGKILVDPANPNRLYDYIPANPGCFILRSDDAGNSWTEEGTGIPTDLAGYSLAYASEKAFQMDPNNPDRLIVGTNRVYQTTNDGSSWTAISPVLSPSGNLSDQYITALAIAPSDGNTIYAATADGRLFITRNDGTSWQESDSALPLNSFDQIVDIKVDPTNPLHAFIVPGRFPTAVFGAARVWTTTTGGSSWTDITGNLPPEGWTNAIVVDWRFATPVLYVATARGVYRSLDTGTTWTRFGAGMPNAPVSDLQFVPAFDLLAAATYGRGVFEIIAPGPATKFNITSVKTVTAGTPFNVTVVAVDALGYRALSYQGTVHFTSTDPIAILPADYAFTSADQGAHTFTNGVTFKTTGTQTLTVTDTVSIAITGHESVTVTAPAGLPGQPLMDTAALWAVLDTCMRKKKPQALIGP